MICLNCSLPFHIKPSRLANRNIKFCGKACRLEYSSKNYLSSLEKRFFSKTKKESVVSSCYETTPCWTWLGNIDKYGYGYLTVMKPNKHKAHAHRISMILFKPEENIDQLHVCHSCHNKLCVNPIHLHVGTAPDNIREMVEAERQAKGIGLPQAKLKEKDVLEILNSLSKGSTRQSLADRYRVSLGTIDKIVQGKTWKHIKR